MRTKYADDHTPAFVEGARGGHLDMNMDGALLGLNTALDGASAPQSTASGLEFAAGSVVREDSLRRGQLAIKRVMDICFALAALGLLLPMLICVAATIKLTSAGPVFFCQQRPGRGGRSFTMFKFRTMFTDQGDRLGIVQTTRDDPRVTPVGRFLRKTSIDELPQLINILIGDMSVVGPRPHVAGMQAAGVDYEELVPYYHERLSMQPGLSGWAQVNGFRGPTDTNIAAIKRIEHDLAYIQNFSLLLDIKIIVGTFRKEFLSGSGF